MPGRQTGASLSQASDLADPQQDGTAIISELPFGTAAALPLASGFRSSGGDCLPWQDLLSFPSSLPPMPVVILSPAPGPVSVPSDRQETFQIHFFISLSMVVVGAPGEADGLYYICIMAALF